MREPGRTNGAAGRGWEAKANQGDVITLRDTPAGIFLINPGRALCGLHPGVGIPTTWHREGTQCGQLMGQTAKEGAPPELSAPPSTSSPICLAAP